MLHWEQSHSGKECDRSSCCLSWASIVGTKWARTSTFSTRIIFKLFLLLNSFLFLYWTSVVLWTPLSLIHQGLVLTSPVASASVKCLRTCFKEQNLCMQNLSALPLLTMRVVHRNSLTVPQCTDSACQCQGLPGHPIWSLSGTREKEGLVLFTESLPHTPHMRPHWWSQSCCVPLCGV